MRTTAVPTLLRAFALGRRPRGVPTLGDFALVESKYNGLEAGQILVRNEWFSVDASMRLRMTATQSPYLTPYAPGDLLDGWAVGRVVETCADEFEVGAYVFHYAGWRNYAVLPTGPAGWVAPRKVVVSQTTRPEHYLGVLGPSGLTSWAGLIHAGELRDGDVVYVSAAAGAVGSLAIQIARLLDHRVIGSAGSDEKARYVTEYLKADGAFNYRRESVSAGLHRLASNGIDLYFDNVGGDHLDAALEAMRPAGRIVLCGAIADYNANEESRPGIKHLFKATERGLTLRGFLARMYADQWDEFHRNVSAWLAEGKLFYPETVVDGLESAPQALINLFEGANIGKTLIRTGS
jgi:NADPH-dependent curcumin reductase CurA